jgi:hypothetical protein
MAYEEAKRIITEADVVLVSATHGSFQTLL